MSLLHSPAAGSFSPKGSLKNHSKGNELGFCFVLNDKVINLTMPLFAWRTKTKHQESSGVVVHGNPLRA